MKVKEENEQQHNYPPQKINPLDLKRQQEETRKLESKNQSHFNLITPNLNHDSSKQPYDSFTSSDINITLKRLLEFWNHLLQDHSLTADLGIQLNHQNISSSLDKFNLNHIKVSSSKHEQFSKETDLSEIQSHPYESNLTPSILSIDSSHQKYNQQSTFKHESTLLLIQETNSNTFPISSNQSTTTTLPKIKPISTKESSNSLKFTPTRPHLHPSAWWLDITCPTSADMHQLGKIFPLHPLTIEDILHQDTREKTETFHGLGYYLICFRGLDPSNFYYKQGDDPVEEENSYDQVETGEKLIRSPSNQLNLNHNDLGIDQKITDNISTKSKSFNTTNLGIKSIILNNIKRIKRKKTPSNNDHHQSHNKETIIIPTLENQSNECDLENHPSSNGSKSRNDTSNSPAIHSSNLFHPNNTSDSPTKKQKKPNYLNRPSLGVVNMYLVVFRDGIISFHFEDVQKHVNHVKDRIQSLSSDTGLVSPHWIAYGLMDSIVDEFFPVLELVEEETDELEEYLLDPLGTGLIMSGNQSSQRRSNWKKMKSKTGLYDKKQKAQMMIKQRIKPKVMMNKHYNYRLKSMSMIDRSKMLNRITFNRRLVVSMARLIAQKFQTVHALRKRMMDDQAAHGSHHLSDPFSDHQSKEIGFYLSDLQDHILSLTQALTFYDSILSNAHLTYLGLLRVGLNSTKQEQDVMIMRLYLITLIVLPMNMLIGLHSMNIHIPANGDQETHRLADGSSAPYTVFFVVLSACFLIGFLFVLFIRNVIINHSQVKFNRSFPKLFYFI